MSALLETGKYANVKEGNVNARQLRQIAGNIPGLEAMFPDVQVCLFLMEVQGLLLEGVSDASEPVGGFAFSLKHDLMIISISLETF